jgi:hypothetical protein
MILLGWNYLCRIHHKKIGQKLEGKLQNMRMNLVAFVSSNTLDTAVDIYSLSV